jgi:putative endonuclease
MLNRRQQYGKEAESIAARHLEKNGYKILERNFRTQLGEIDIIAKDRETVVFVEVKARRSNSYGNPKWSITARKQRKISMLALYYLKTSKLGGSKARFDVVAIDSASAQPRIEIVKNAFDLAYE